MGCRPANQGTTDFASSDDVFVTPKPVALVSRVLELATREHSIILDSFAGSATTAQAVLAANNRDGGDRRFILVECEDYAETLTAERVRRVINGYPFNGRQRETLHRQSLTFTDLRSADRLLHRIAGIENLEAHRFDRIKKEVKAGVLTVEGINVIRDKTAGLGGAFTFCTLGEPVELDKILNGETLPNFEGLGAVLFHMATNRALNPAQIRDYDFYLGATPGQHVWLLYKPDLDWLKSPEAALTLARAKEFAATDHERRHLVFAPARYVSQKMLDEQQIPVEFVPLPFALYRIDRA